MAWLRGFNRHPLIPRKEDNMNMISTLRARASQASIAVLMMASSNILLANALPGNTSGGGTSATTSASLVKFLGNIQGLLSVASIAVVTIAVIVAGYQIAFNNKRISDVAPILVGGLLIGAAGQIASMLVGGQGAY